MKKFFTLFTIILLLITFNISAQQNIILKTEAVSIKVMDSVSGTWSEWSTYAELHVVCMYKPDKNMYIIYTKVRQSYSVLYDIAEYVASDGNQVAGSECVDEEGIECALLFIVSPKGEKYIQIAYADARILYKLETPDN